jgi:hypothetical protein
MKQTPIFDKLTKYFPSFFYWEPFLQFRNSICVCVCLPSGLLDTPTHIFFHLDL